MATVWLIWVSTNGGREELCGVFAQEWAARVYVEEENNHRRHVEAACAAVGEYTDHVEYRTEEEDVQEVAK